MLSIPDGIVRQFLRSSIDSTGHSAINSTQILLLECHTVTIYAIHICRCAVSGGELGGRGTRASQLLKVPPPPRLKMGAQIVLN